MCLCYSLQLNISPIPNFHIMSHAILIDSSHFLYNIHPLEFYFIGILRKYFSITLYSNLKPMDHLKANLDGMCLGGQPLTNVCFLC